MNSLTPFGKRLALTLFWAFILVGLYLTKDIYNF
jgi:hypothetical protein